MGEHSAIEWTDHTFNPWWGCTKVSPGCAHCYAEALDKRTGGAHWGPGAPRRLASPQNWQQPHRWAKEIRRQRSISAFPVRRQRVFCASMADWCDPEAPASAVDRLWATIDDTRDVLDWLLLTKRPHLIRDRLPSGWGDGWSGVWLGTTVEDQRRADERIPHLLAVPARVRFLSCEPLLGPVDLRHMRTGGYGATTRTTNVLTGETLVCMYDGGAGIERDERKRIHWIIAGGESGPGARPMHPEWARSLRDQAQAAGVAFHFKQWGEWSPRWQGDDRGDFDSLQTHTHRLVGTDGRGGCSYDTSGPDAVPMSRVGKRAAGRLLDGRTWDEVPA